jgi:OOP family OmpA-OmpF porin
MKLIKNSIIITTLIVTGCASAPEKPDLKAEAEAAAAEQARIAKLQARAEKEKAEEEARKKQQELEKLEAMRKKNPKLKKKLAKWEKSHSGRLVVTLLDELLFDIDKSDLKSEAKRDIKILAKFLKKYPHLKVSVEGHTDNRGNSQHNLGLSERRATSVKFALMEHDIASTRITVKGFGESRPIASNNKRSGRKKNRRVEIIIHRAN